MGKDDEERAMQASDDETHIHTHGDGGIEDDELFESFEQHQKMPHDDVEIPSDDEDLLAVFDPSAAAKRGKKAAGSSRCRRASDKSGDEIVGGRKKAAGFR
jgi:hypothetical protein